MACRDAESSEHLPFHRSIGGRIFGLAVFLLALTIILTGFLLWQMERTERDINIVATVDIPLADAITEVDYLAVRRRLAFERWFGALNAEKPNQAVIKEASDNYQTFTKELREAAVGSKAMLDAYPPEQAANPKLVKVQMLFDQLINIYPTMTKRQMEVMDIQKSGDHDKANTQLDFINDTQTTVTELRTQMKNTMQEISADAAQEVAARQKVVLWIAVAASSSAIMLGLVVAWMITRHLTHPIRSLLTAMNNVQQGNLDEGNLPIPSSDEIGLLTRSFNYFVEEMRVKEQIKSTFGKYIDPRVLERVLLQSDSSVDTVNKRVMTVSFADLVGFTGLSERLTPALMVAVLNRHFGLQAQMVHNYQGVVDKFIGDALMAFWGPPFVSPEEHPAMACRAALAQLAVIDTFRKELPDITGLRKDAPSIDLRIGICTGEMVVGNIGSELTRSYTVIGDTVNLSSRLEGANRIYGTHILIGEPTQQAVADIFETREIDAIAVKGRKDPTRIYELLGQTGAIAERVRQLRDAFAAGLLAYREQRWDEAENIFSDCLQLVPDDGPSQVFLDRISELRRNPPPSTWDGVWRMNEK
jgi:class 3 adenylate cyclase